MGDFVANNVFAMLTRLFKIEDQKNQIVTKSYIVNESRRLLFLTISRTLYTP